MLSNKENCRYTRENLLFKQTDWQNNISGKQSNSYSTQHAASKQSVTDRTMSLIDGTDAYTM